MRTIRLLLVGLLLVGCGEEAAPRTGASATTGPTTTATAEPAAAKPPKPAKPIRHVIPGDFPLADGYPSDDEAESADYGLEEPHRAGEPLDLSPCDTTVLPTAYTDLLRAGWRNVVDGRDRQLVTFRGEPAAAAYVDAVLAAYRACPAEQGAGWSSSTEMYETDLGDQSGAAATRGDGSSALDVVHVVRVDRAVLVATTGSEGGAGPDGTIDRAVRADADAIAGVVEAMRVTFAPPPDDFAAEPPFGPEGFGQVVLGMSAAALAAVPGVRLTAGEGGCRPFTSGAVAGALDPDLGVASLTPLADLETPERVTPYASLRELRAAYPDGVHDAPHFVAPVPGYDDRSYRFEVGRSLALVLDGRHCAG